MLPLFFGQLFTAALIKLRLEPTAALLVVIGILLGSPINIPVKRIPERNRYCRTPGGVWTIRLVADVPARSQRHHDRRQRRRLPHSRGAGAL